MIRMGIIDYINSYPIFYGITNGFVKINAQLTYGSPVEINAQLRSQKIDIALISSEEFMRNKESYVTISNLGIAATGPVISVRFFFDSTIFPHISLLNDQTVYVPSVSATSVQLFKALCVHCWKISPKYEFYSEDPSVLYNKNVPFLCIGDPCLKLIEHSIRSSIDISNEWHTCTGRSVTFALIATKKDFFERYPQEVKQIDYALFNSYEYAQNHVEKIIEICCKKTCCSPILIKKYYSLLEHRLEQRHFKDLEYLSSLV